jgi:hypothetical protein
LGRLHLGRQEPGPYSGGYARGAVGQDYAQPLSVRVTDYYGNAIIGAALTFTAPASGPSGIFSSSRTATEVVQKITNQSTPSPVI